MNRGRHSFRILRRTLLVSALVAACFPGFLASRAEQATALDLNGSPVDPFKSSAGKIVVLIFVRTDCPVANRYSPTIQRLSARHSEKAAVWLVYPSKADSPEMIRKHDHDFGYRLPALRDLQHGLVKLGHVQITPEASVFDARRRLIYHGRIDNLFEDFGRARTAATTHELDDAIEAAIRGRTPSTDTAPAIGCYISDLE
jgi:hypothetical protein